MEQEQAPLKWRGAASPRHSVGTPLCLGLACLMVVTLSCGKPPSGTTIATVPRQDVIPSDIQKVTPTTDEHPPILHTPDFLQPEPLTGSVNTAGAEDSAFVTPEGDALYFFFTPDVRIPPESQLIDGVTGIYVSTKQDDTWAEVQRVPLQNQGELALDGCVFVQADCMWFCSARQGNYHGVDMWTAERREGRWLDWENAGEQVNIDLLVGEMHITADDQSMYYHSDLPGGWGGMDIWVIEREGEGWGVPQNVEAVNTPETDGWPFVTEDGNEL